jgi:16S rRNA (uracil1498-N3)-methyltransferase
VPEVAPVLALAEWLQPPPAGARLLLSLRANAQPLASLPLFAAGDLTALSGPEGGLTPAEEAAAVAQGFIAVALGPRVMRADTAPLAVLAWLALQPMGPGPRGG